MQFGRLAGEISLGGHTLHEPIASLPLAQGRIGSEVLKHFRITIDAGCEHALFEREEKAPGTFTPWKSHGAGFVRQGNQEVVGDVVPGSPAAELGLKIGDIVLYRGSDPNPDHEVSSEALTEFDGEFVCLRRDGRIIQIALPHVILIR